MGKALIIKNADFSVNSIEDLNLDGIRTLTPENAIATFTGSIVVQNNTLGLVAGSIVYKIFKIEANELLVIPRQIKSNNYFGVYFATSLSTTLNTNVPLAFLDCPKILIPKVNFVGDSTSSLSIKGDKVYYAYVIQSGNISNVDYKFPDSLLAKQEYIPNRTLTIDNYDSSIDLKYPTDVTWGTSAPCSDGKPNGMIYNLHQGETVHIKANSVSGARYIIFSQELPPKHNAPTTVSVDTEVEIPITQHGLAIYFYRGENNPTRFPAELYTYLTPETNN